MKKQLYAAAISGNTEFLREARTKDVESAAATYNDADFLGSTSHGNNIIHVATQHGHLDFIVEALQSFTKAADRRKLICGINSDGDTPLHFAAKQRTRKIAQHLTETETETEMDMEASRSQNAWTWSWRVQNKDGNTPLHVALLNGGRSIQVAAYLLEIGPEVANFTNKHKESPLHLAVTYDNQGTEISTLQMINTLNGQGAALTCRKSLFKKDSHSHSHSHLDSLIRSLLKRNSDVCCWRDADGLTPLHRAAINYNLPAVEAIIKDCPESIEIRDPKGKNLLHHMRLQNTSKARKFLEIPEISVLLINQQDDDGNTPMHIAAMNRDFGMVKAMVECDSNFAIKNKQGDSAQTLFHRFAINDEQNNDSTATQIPSKSNSLSNILGKENEIELIKEELMSEELYKAANDEEWETLTKRLEEASENDKWFVSRLPDGSNIMHIAVEGFRLNLINKSIENCSVDPSADSREWFIVSALKKLPVLSSQTNHRGETPLHLAMYRETLKPDGPLFSYIKQYFKQIIEDTTYEFCVPLPPWKVKTAQGNTLLHLALLYSRVEVAEYLIELDAKLVEEINNLKETPLHMLCRNMSDHDSTGFLKPGRPLDGRFDKLVELLLKKDVSAAYARDAEGFTPLLRATHDNHLGVAVRILYHCPQSIRHYDYQGRNIFHWLRLFGKKECRIHELCKVALQMRALMNSIDDEGNTPLHLAFRNKAFGTAKYLISNLDDNFKYRGQLLYEMKTLHTRLDEVEVVPGWFTNFVLSKLMKLGPQFDWSYSRSYYGVPKKDVKEYMSALGVVAALLTTLTFTAAFAVPGGYDDSTGSPKLSTKVAFQVFMLSDVVGMCSSMMVLFCLLWILNANHYYKMGGLMIVDTTILLLQVSFYATLVAFMAGVYVTTYRDTRWLAISTCVLCTAVILLMRRRLIMSYLGDLFVIPAIAPQIFLRRLKRFAKYIISHASQTTNKCRGEQPETELSLVTNNGPGPEGSLMRGRPRAQHMRAPPEI